MPPVSIHQTPASLLQNHERSKWASSLASLSLPLHKLHIFISQLFLKRHDAATVCSETETFSSNLTWIRLLAQSPAHTVRFWPWFGRLRQILKIQKDSYNPRLKSEVWIVQRQPINGQIWLPTKFWQSEDLAYSSAVWLLQRRTSNCLHFQDKLWAELMLDNYSISQKLRRSRPPLTEFIWYVALSI